MTFNHYNLFLDDYRLPNVLNDNRVWILVRNYKEFVKMIEDRGLPKMISFDHDLADEHYPALEKNVGINNSKELPYDTYQEKTGYHCAKWLIGYCLDQELPLPEYNVHSMNPVGKENIIALLENFKHYQKQKEI